jgi:hypothetical protein
MSNENEIIIIEGNIAAANHIVTFRGHRPGSVDIDDPLPQREFSSLDELLTAEGIVGFSEHENFSGYALIIDEPVSWIKNTEHHLMATYKDGAEWWVVGYLSNNAKDLFDLPVWEARKPGYIPKKEKEMTTQEQTQPSKKISREDRIVLAHSYFGWYTFGMATNDAERIDENVAMDNGGVPFYEDQLTDKHKEVLKRHKENMAQVSPHIGAAAGVRNTVNLDAPLFLDDEQAQSLSDILNRRYATVMFNANSVPDERFKVVTWPTNDNLELPKEEDLILLGLYGTQTEADRHLELFTARSVYAAIKQFLIKETINFNK